MSVLIDKEIIGLCENVEFPMISPFLNHQVKVDSLGNKIVSAGLSSAGYDVRLAEDFKVFTDLNSSIVDPLNFDPKCLHDYKGDYVIIPPNSYMLGKTIEYFRIPKDIMVVCVGKSTYARCFTGDTKVALVNGEALSFIELIERASKGERFWGYSINDTGEIVVTELIEPRFIAHEKILEIVLDNDEVISCTPDHKFISRDGQEIEAKDLTIGQSLFPLYRYVARGYETVVQQTSFTWAPTHRLADHWNIRHGVYTVGSNEHRHHIDHNRRNNIPINIMRVDASAHIKHHNEERALDTDFIERMSDIQKESFSRNSKDPIWYNKFVEKCKAAAHRFWHDKDLEEARKAHHEKLLERMENMTIEERANRSERMRIYSILESSKLRASNLLKTLWKDPLFRAAKIEHAGKLNLREDITEKHLEDALKKTGTIDGAAAMLKCDRATFRRYPEILTKFKSLSASEKLTEEIVIKELSRSGSVGRAAYRLGVLIEDIFKFNNAVEKFYGTPIAANHKVKEIRLINKTEDVYCLTAPEFSNFALESGVFVKNCGAIVNVTPIEPGFEGNIVIEVSNSTRLPLKIYANQGISQFIFFKARDNCNVSYSDRKGKYQGQTSIQTAIG